MTSSNVVEPTADNLNRFKKTSPDGTSYWHTADFFPIDPDLEPELNEIFDIVMDLVVDADADIDEQSEDLTALDFAIGRHIVRAARSANVTPRYFADHFNNYTTVIWTPICIWKPGDNGDMSYSLMSNLPQPQRQPVG